MLRTQLSTIANAPGKPDRKTKPNEFRASVEQDLRAYFKTKEGRQALLDAPRVSYTDRGELKHRQMTEDDAVEALLEELGA